MRHALLVLLVACGASKPPLARERPFVPATRGPEGGEPAEGPLDGLLRIQAASHCGGAAIPDDDNGPPMLPAPDVWLEVSQGDFYGDSLPQRLKTDREGRFRANLEPGRYCIARPRGPKPTKAPSPDYDLDCLVTQWERCDVTVEVPVKTVIQLDIHEPCEGLSCYHGPPPP